MLCAEDTSQGYGLQVMGASPYKNMPYKILIMRRLILCKKLLSS